MQNEPSLPCPVLDRAALAFAALRGRMRWLSPSVALLFAAARVEAQLPCGTPAINGAPYVYEMWVDPVIGDDTTALINDPTLPAKTIRAAITRLKSQSMSSPLGPLGLNNQGLVHVDPGIYSRSTTLEVLPIVMEDWIDVQGVGAKQVVVRGDHTQLSSIFYPDSDCDCGELVDREVIFDFSRLRDTQYAEMLDGVTLQGGDVQLYVGPEREVDGRVSNCVFDMLENDSEETFNVRGPEFGILMVHTYDVELKQEEKYWDIRLHVLNNTFVQSWDPVPSEEGEPAFSARDDSVAICDVNDPNCFGTGEVDPQTRLRGVGNPNIQNNLIRAFDPTPATALMGIDLSDVSCAIGTTLGPTNAFDPASFGNSNGRFCSLVLGNDPVPRTTAGGVLLNPNVRTGGVDPTFVGEFLTSQTGGAIASTFGRDWRLMPDSILADEGTAPVLVGFDMVLEAANLTRHVDLACTAASSFDFDGEVYGNPRLHPSPLAGAAAPPNPDIGFDEIGFLVDSASINDTVRYNALTPITPFGAHIYIQPRVAGSPLADFSTISGVPTALPLFPPTAWTVIPGSAVPPVNGGGFFAAPYDWLWLAAGPAVVLVPFGPQTAFPYVSLYDATAHICTVTLIPAFNAGVYIAQQGFYVPGGGPNAGLNLLTNEQGVED